MIRVLICDDQQVVCEGLKTILGTASSIEVVGVVHDGQQAVDAVARQRPDVVLMDLNMPRHNGIVATRTIRTQFARVRVLVLTTYEADEWLFDAIRAGASGYLLKDSTREELIAAIEGTAAGRTHVDPAVAGRLLSQVAKGGSAPTHVDLGSLTDRERDVLRLLGRGVNNADIASRLHLSEGTVRNHVSAILQKLGVQDRTQAALVAMQSGLT